MTPSSPSDHASAPTDARPAGVVQILAGLGFGGNETLALRLLEHAPPGVGTTVLALDPDKRDLEDAFARVPGTDLRYGRGPEHGRLAFLLWTARQVAAIRPRAVLVHTFGLAHVLVALAVIAGRWMPRPQKYPKGRPSRPRVLVSAANPPPLGGGARWKWRLIVLASRGLRVPIMSCSQAVHSELLGLGAGLPAGSAAIPSACDVATIRARAAASRAGRSDPDTITVGMVARLEAIKDQETLIRAAARLRDRPGLPAYAVLLVGDGPRRGALEALASDLGVDGIVRFAGARPDVPDLLGLMDLYVFSTTRSEGFGIALAEAMAAGLPVLASDVPACRELLDEGRAGLLFARGDAAGLADLLDAAMRDGARRRALGLRAAARATAAYDIPRCADEWYRALLGDGTRR